MGSQKSQGRLSMHAHAGYLGPSLDLPAAVVPNDQLIQTISSSARVASARWSPPLLSPVSSLRCFLQRGLHFNPTRDRVVVDALGAGQVPGNFCRAVR